MEVVDATATAMAAVKMATVVEKGGTVTAEARDTTVIAAAEDMMAIAAERVVMEIELERHAVPKIVTPIVATRWQQITALRRAKKVASSRDATMEIQMCCEILVAEESIDSGRLNSEFGASKNIGSTSRVSVNVRLGGSAGNFSWRI
ncbi:MAG: hypothetical protein ABJN26_03720 [Stappiaceae bacterium]